MKSVVLGQCHTVAATFTRPSDTTAYASGDVVCNSTSVPTIMTFADALKYNNAVLQHAMIVTSANVATKPDLELWLFDTTVAMDNDNAAFTPTDAELLNLVGVVSFATGDFKAGDATGGAGGNAICEATNLGIPINPAAADDLYGILVARNAYVPVSGEVFTVRLKFLD
jgi:hypothetical protein